jgi:hypothetical protein
MQSDRVVREQLLALLRGGNAHMGFDRAVADFPPEYFNTRPANVSYTPWHILEHMRLAQWDILEFMRNPDHVSPPWPAGYWPPPAAEADQAQWDKTISQFRADLQALQDIVADPGTDLYAPIPHAPGYTILREILVVADHNAYHTGEFAVLRQVMGTWPASFF